MEDKRFVVWVGGGEVNHFLLTKEDAVDTANLWKGKGYDDVVIEDVYNEEIITDF